MKVINIFAGPGAGKSRLARELSLRMSDAGFNVTLRTEYAEDLLYEQRADVLNSNQLHVMSGQYQRIYSLLDHNFDYAIIDSPILLSSVYNRRTKNPICPESFEEIAVELFSRFQNINVFLKRDHKAFPFRESGRVHDENESSEIDGQILEMFERINLKMPMIKNCTNIGEKVFKCILEQEALAQRYIGDDFQYMESSSQHN